MAEVDFQLKKITKDPFGELQDLAKDPILLTKGPGNQLYITDHHHGALAWMRYLEKTKAGHHSLCEISNDFSSLDLTAFITTLKEKGLVHLENEAGRQISFDELPSGLDKLRDDPYRSLAWMLRKDGAWCRYKGKVEFAEFVWADYLRDLGVSRRFLKKDEYKAADSAVRSRNACEVVGWQKGYIGNRNCPQGPEPVACPSN